MTRIPYDCNVPVNVTDHPVVESESGFEGTSELILAYEESLIHMASGMYMVYILYTYCHSRTTILENIISSLPAYYYECEA